MPLKTKRPEGFSWGENDWSSRSAFKRNVIPALACKDSMLCPGGAQSTPSRLVENCEFTGPFRIASQTLAPVAGIPRAILPDCEIASSLPAPPSGTKTESIHGFSVGLSRFATTPSRNPLFSCGCFSPAVLGSKPTPIKPVPKPLPPPTISARSSPWLSFSSS